MNMPELTMGQFELVYAFLSLTIAAMGASAVFFFLGRSNVGEKYRPAVLMSGLVVGIACYHYVRIFLSWNEAYTLANGVYVASGVPFLDSYRYADWLLTVPLLVAELVAVLALPKGQSRSLIARLAIASVLMIATGYPGEIAEDAWTKHVWGWVSSVPFLYIVYALWAELGKAVERQTPEVQSLFRNIRYLLLATWGVYPIAYLVSALGLGGGATAEVALQIGYSVADITAKAGFGLMIYAIARAKTEADQRVTDATVAGRPTLEPATA
ncbi:MAG: bacteriorhodopsin-like [Sandaracinaceae bacterium]